MTAHRPVRVIRVSRWGQHARLVRYFKKRGFVSVREVGSSPIDLPLRTIWGGAGSLMTADCHAVLERSCRLWEISR